MLDFFFKFQSKPILVVIILVAFRYFQFLFIVYDFIQKLGR